MHKLAEASKFLGESVCNDDLSLLPDEMVKAELNSHVQLTDYSILFGEEFKLPEDQWDASYLNVMDVAAVEEGVLHLLFGCASQVRPSNCYSRFFLN